MRKIKCPVWCHGTPEKQWCNSGWLYMGHFFPCLYSNDKNGDDKVIGRWLETVYQEHKQAQNAAIEFFSWENPRLE